eukprot:CAMPEP_0180209238 /NCGR_PEP_ID=MMETSP0987-20121128/11312_1 /TAXON_ID=697907 /ORGANISM="non described non described, Strain CCMP2293" /LENGTH=81 /DNA_ID=CAMNT_0022165729 /DNA_START=336 /DNA_END=579 /DNA_ORIENTATION=-
MTSGAQASNGLEVVGARELDAVGEELGDAVLHLALSDEGRRAVVEREGLLAALRLAEHQLSSALTPGEHLSLMAFGRASLR